MNHIALSYPSTELRVTKPAHVHLWAYIPNRRKWTVDCPLSRQLPTAVPLVILSRQLQTVVSKD